MLMFNAYTITLSLFIIASLGVTGWSLHTIFTAGRRLKWPNVNGIIEESSPGSILFSYHVKEQDYHHTMDISMDMTPGQEIATSHVSKYPQGKEVIVYYQPENPENATIEPALANDVWLIFILSIAAALTGAIFLFL